ncbi:glycosyltransferase [Mycobacterium sp. DL592]|uniref:glycosyltransferase n=1 Tax=Mycobacterium sp. DL592 TaxID=2675524 RepID=UPI0014229782|nr:glycosyltransferase [Mycobacterium sp. DL592]
MNSAPTIAIVHERLTEFAGSEQVVEQLAAEWPSARIHVPIAAPGSDRGAMQGRAAVTPADRVHRLIGRRSHAVLLPSFIPAFKHMDFGDVDAVVISHHSAALSAVHATTDRPTVAYVHSPARWAWDPAMREGEASGFAGRTALTGLAALIRRAEAQAAPKLTQIVANSSEVAARIRRWWGRDAAVVHPPVNTDLFTPDDTGEREDFFLLAGRLVPYKRPDLAIAAANAAGVPLVVAGEGRRLAECQAVAGPKTIFLGRVSDEEMLRLQRRARALLMPGIEDFGIVPVESMACGTPVIATGAGGALDSVVPGLSGQLVEPGTDRQIVAGFTEALRTFDGTQFDSKQVRKHAEQFSHARFREQMRAVVDSVL